MAKFRGRLPRKGPLPFRYVLLLTFVFFIFSTAAGLWIINEGIKPTLMRYAKSQTRNIATLVINNAVTNEFPNVDINDIVETVPNENEDGTTNLYNFNTEKINRLEGEITKIVQRNLKKAQNGDLSSLETQTDVDIETDPSPKEEGIVYYVPLGQATNNALLGNLGPKIPVRFSAIGDVRPDVKWKVEDHGINNMSVRVWIHIEVNVQIIIPFATDITTVTKDIPVAMRIIPGKVPQFYNKGGGSSPSIELPGQR